MKILIGADIVPTNSNMIYFEENKVDKLIDKNLEEYLKTADFRVLNLEVPLVDYEMPIKKCGPSLVASTDSIIGIKSIGVDLLTLANNHIMDQGEEGLYSTINKLRQNDIKHIGAGRNIQEAAKPYIFNKDGINVGIYACAEHEFSIANDRHPGANPFDALESLDHISNLKEETDYVIVLYHGGKEEYRYPSPNLQKVCRKMIDKGADIVICQHTHCIGCKEEWNKGTIVYGQGNFLFDLRDNEYWGSSLLIEANLNNKGLEINYVPILKDGYGVALGKGEDAKVILNNFDTRSDEIKNPDNILIKYRKFASTKRSSYYKTFLAKLSKNIFFKGINKIFQDKLINILFDKESELALINYIECEAHRELLLEILGEDVYEE